VEHVPPHERTQQRRPPGLAQSRHQYRKKGRFWVMEASKSVANMQDAPELVEPASARSDGEMEGSDTDPERRRALSHQRRRSDTLVQRSVRRIADGPE
jgi:hypothetical protein